MDLNSFKLLLDGLGGAVTSIANIADGFRSLVFSGVGGIDAVRTKAMYGRLLNQSALLVGLNLKQRALAGRLKGYFRDAPDLGPDKREKLWRHAMADLAAVLERITSCLGILLHERSEFVLEEPYLRMCMIVGNPVSLLAALERIQPPVRQRNYSRSVRSLNVMAG